MSYKSTRRHFLKSAALGVTSLGLSEMLFSRLFSQLSTQALAQTLAPNPSGYYFHLSMPSAPPRWMFDLPLTPMGQTAGNFKPGGFGNFFENVAGATNVIHKALPRTIAGKTLYLPPVWGYHTSKNFDSLLRHCLFVRGMDMEIDNHSIGNQRNISPIIGGLSLTGVVSDKSNRALAAVVDGGSQSANLSSFKSRKGTNPNLISSNSALTTNVVAQALSPFTKLTATYNHIAGQNLALQEQVLNRLDSQLLNAGHSTNRLTETYEQAADLMATNITNIGNSYPTVATKYANLVQQAINPAKGSLPGLFSNNIIVKNTSREFQMGQFTSLDTLKLTDLRDMIGTQSAISRMASTFAIMEIMSDQLSTNFAMSLSAGNTLNNLVTGSANAVTITADQHYIGRHISTLVTTLYYRALLSCLTEFVDALKDKNIFDKSVIHISAEFNRIPRVDGSGSDHGIIGSNATLISGKFNKPEVIGNIKINTAGARGTWGESATYFPNGNMAIRVNDVARSVSSMLGVADIVSNGDSLVKQSGNFWVPKKSEANNV